MSFIRHQVRRLTGSGFIAPSLRQYDTRVLQSPAKYCTISDYNEDELVDNQNIASLRTVCKIPGVGQRVLAIQPNIRRGSKKIRTREAIVKLDESVSLLKTLRGWKVINKTLINTDHPKSEYVFGPGNLSELVAHVNAHVDITAVYIGLDVMTGMQKYNLEQLLRVPVFDKYSIVLEIFREHAQTSVARLQTALAEIPYVRAQIANVHESAPRPSAAAKCIGGSGETYISQQRSLLNIKEDKIKKALANIKKTRQVVREARKKRRCPSVAVVGYTNSGKTSVIQALTHDESLEPMDQLFATLDVTAHPGTLGAGNVTVTYIDTVGFISDIPTTLIESFAATLEDAVHADILLHVCDISNKHYLDQRNHVLKTLEHLQVCNISEMIEAFNKVDLCEQDISDLMIPTHCGIPVSALTGDGMELLKDKIEELVMSKNGRKSYMVKIPIVNNAPHLSWLHKNASVVGSSPCDNTDNHLLVTVIMDHVTLLKFKARFGDLLVS